ncbi:MAG: hypothetical protein LBU27_01655 [Candidatus Peribacteria bacterium]|nr:hypothetical protein [Candidatus Peribacteria bacterium]
MQSDFIIIDKTKIIDFCHQNAILPTMSSSHKLVIKDAVRQLFGRLISALFGFVITKIIASYL